MTPFSARALDRGLSGVMVALMRLWEERLNGNLKAGELQDTDPLMPAVFAQLARRAENATHDATVAQRMRDMLDRRRDEWLKRVHNQKGPPARLPARRWRYGRLARTRFGQGLGDVHMP